MTGKTDSEQGDLYNLLPFIYQFITLQAEFVQLTKRKVRSKVFNLGYEKNLNHVAFFCLIRRTER